MNAGRDLLDGIRSEALRECEWANAFRACDMSPSDADMLSRIFRLVLGDELDAEFADARDREPFGILQRRVVAYFGVLTVQAALRLHDADRGEPLLAATGGRATYARLCHVGAYMRDLIGISPEPPTVAAKGA